MNREAIYANLFACGQQVAGFVTKSRKLRHIEEMEPAEFPAFFQVQTDEEWHHGRNNGNLPPVGDLHAEWWVYVYEPDASQPHSPKLNAAVDSLLATLGLPPAPPGYKQTLGGKVESVQLDGKIAWADGALADRSFARISLTMKTTG